MFTLRTGSGLRCNLLTMCKCTNGCPLCAPECLGDFSACGTLTTGRLAANTGAYTLKTKYQGALVTKQQDQTANTEISFDLSGLNENYTFDAEILDPEGNTAAFVRFTTRPEIAIA